MNETLGFGSLPPGIKRAAPFLFIAMSVFLWSREAVAVPFLIGSEVTSDTLFRIDLNSSLLSPIGPLADPIVASLTFDRNHSILYASSTDSNRLLRINPTTAEISVVGDLGVTLVHAIEYDANHDVLYGASTQTDRLFTINVATGAISDIGPTGIDRFGGMAYDDIHDVMYVTDAGPSGSTGLFKVDLNSGAATLVGPFDNPEIIQITGLAFDRSLGLFGVDNRFGGDNQLLSIDRSTGQATFVRELIRGNFLGLTFIVPEPTTFAPFAVAGLIIATIRRR